MLYPLSYGRVGLLYTSRNGPRQPTHATKPPTLLIPDADYINGYPELQNLTLRKPQGKVRQPLNISMEEVDFMSETKPKENQPLATAILEDVIAIITNPMGFYRRMPKAGGYGDPVMFVLVIAVVTAMAMAAFSLFGLGTVGGAMAVGFGGIIFLPIMALIFSFIGAGILFVVWKMIGSQEPFEVAYRCVAYAAGLFPITAIAGLIPYLGSIVGIVWWTYLMIIASMEVHHLPPKTAYVVFGILGLFFVATNLSSEIAARRMASQFESLGGNLKQLEGMSPEEAGEAVGKFLKGLEKATKEQ